MLIPNIPDTDATLEARLRDRAASNGHLVEEEARRIIDAALPAKQISATSSLAQEIHDLFAPFGGVKLDIPPRSGRSREMPAFD